MIWKRYQNEFIVAVAVLFLIATLSYKQHKIAGVDQVKMILAHSTMEAGEIISLKKQWSNPNLSKDVRKLKNRIAASKVKQFVIKGKKLHAFFQNLNAKETSSIVTRVENIAVVIMKLEIKKVDKSYKVEIQCKW